LPQVRVREEREERDVIGKIAREIVAGVAVDQRPGLRIESHFVDGP
jgi:hypothetical protein